MLFYCCVHVVLCHWRASWYKPSRNHLKTCASKLIVVSIANYNHNNNKKQQTTKKEPIHNIRLKSGSLRVPIDCSHSCIRSIGSFFLVVVVRCIFCLQSNNKLITVHQCVVPTTCHLINWRHARDLHAPGSNITFAMCPRSRKCSYECTKHTMN